MSTYLADVAVLARKDLKLELRARNTVPAMLLFVVAALVVFHFALPASSSDLAAKGLLWVAIVFTALLGLTRAFVAEREQRLPGSPAEAGVGGERNWDVEVEDLLREPLVRVHRRVEEDQRDRPAQQRGGEGRQHGDLVIP